MIKRILVLITILFSLKGVAQKNSSSPYSYFGIGQGQSSATVEQLSMGGVGVSYGDAYHVNLINPALASKLRLTTYTVGLNTRALNVESESGGKQKARSTSFSYLAMGIPVGEKGGFVFGLDPRTTVGYDLTSIMRDGDDISEINYFKGEGGTNRVFANFGYEVFKGLSLGVEGSYIFGKIENDVIKQVNGVQYATKYGTSYNVKGTSLKLGGFYQYNLKNKMQLNFGATTTFESKLNTNGNEQFYSLLYIDGVEYPNEFLFDRTIEGSYTTPMRNDFGFGIGIENKWFVGVDYSMRSALDLSGDAFPAQNIQYKDYSKIAVGGFYLPKQNSISSYWQRVIYRVGFKYEKPGFAVRPTGSLSDFTEIDDFGISFGLGLPLGKKLSNLNLGFEFGRRGDNKDGLIQENYFNFRVGLSLNDKWFNKHKID
ncbi:hypothetical protein [Aureivirga sp. CE67]|uniref:hypothetical protein n=1 Tax=Aureivirga sp. CE67 TaxID=1788983 RepID=UPI0018CA4CCA|nr:hypothetical protein [Aureivirga sp. CE67]